MQGCRRGGRSRTMNTRRRGTGENAAVGGLRHRESLRSQGPIKAAFNIGLFLQISGEVLASAEEGWLAWMEGGLAGRRIRRRREGGRCQWCGDWPSRWVWLSGASGAVDHSGRHGQAQSQRRGGHRKKALYSVEKKGGVSVEHTHTHTRQRYSSCRFSL